MSRRRLIPLLIGIISSIVGFAVVARLRQTRCAGAGGQWDAVAGVCSMAAGRVDIARGSDLLAGMAIALVLAVILHRASTFANRARPSA